MRKLVLARFWLAGGFLILLVLLALLLAPQSAVPDVPMLGDKAKHCIAFAGLTGWFCGVFERRFFLRLIAAMIVFGISTELQQSGVITTRDGGFGDFIAHVIGIGA
ncbi:MAG: hypothetical protein AAF004_12115, partial [Pseudomonadota bacterium]